MKIIVVSRKWIKEKISKNPDWSQNKNIISIFSSGSYSPIDDRFNVLKLKFDDIVDIPECERMVEKYDLIIFNKNHAKKIYEFINECNSNKPFYVHCDAGVSRSGAVGYILNEWFNKYLENNTIDNQFFLDTNSHIAPNPLVVRIMKDVFWGKPTFANIEVNDYSFNEDGEKIDNIERI